MFRITLQTALKQQDLEIDDKKFSEDDDVKDSEIIVGSDKEKTSWENEQ